MNFDRHIGACLLGSALLGLFSQAALAMPTVAVFDFSNLKSINSGFLPDGVISSDYWACTGSDLCSSNVDDFPHPLGGNLKYTSNGITATATAFFKTGQATVVQDHDPNYNASRQIGAGLGVYHVAGDNSDDNITRKERLVLTFANDVQVSALSLRSEGHTVNFSPNSTFLYNGVSTNLAGSINFAIPLTSKVFSFAYGGSNPDQFYLGGLTVTPVPEPDTYALLLAGLGLLGFASRRKLTGSDSAAN